MPFGILICKTWNSVNIIIFTTNYCAYCGLFFFNLTERDKQLKQNKYHGKENL